MTGKRKYDDGCAVAHGLDLIGERWALLVVRELLLGPKRFTDLRAGLSGASSDVLTQRLRELTRSGITRRRKLAPPAGSWVYELTDWGMELEPIVTQLGRWSSRSPALQTDAKIGADSLVLSFRALFDPRAAGDLTATVALRLHEQEFGVRIADGVLDVSRGPVERPHVVISTDPDTLSELLHDGRQLSEALRAGDAHVEGSSQVAEHFLTLFPLPVPAPLPADA
ncbi:winged helix-turn-helix transcriptional regulator [Nonomuraea sp. NPDC050790]|uniref:winged helix-turn-helix transcriptional regulator n=1 Tax=Nonomuraea sp. NPDC050790 TaxID=3364371 RepID=UPI0037A321FC